MKIVSGVNEGLERSLVLVDQRRAALTWPQVVRGSSVKVFRNIAVAWSGGKDSMALLQKVLEMPHTGISLFNIQDKGERLAIGAPFNPELIRLQADCLGRPIEAVQLKADYFDSLDQVVRGYARQGIDTLGMGYLAARGQRDLVHKLAAHSGVSCFEPFVGRSHQALIRERLASGVKAVIVGVDMKALDASWLGRLLDRDLVDYLSRRRGVSLCGENNEYQTLVIDSPLFRKRIDLVSAGTVMVRGRAYLFVDRARAVIKT